MKVVNFTADGNFNVLDLSLDWGQFKVQARTAVEIQVRPTGSTDYWTIKSGSSEVFDGGLAGGLEFKANNGVVIEVLFGFSSRGSI